MIEINENLRIPLWEVSFTFSRAGGPGGQHVNKVSTRVTLWFDLRNSPSLSEEQKGMVARKLATRINKNGVLWLVSYRHRSQGANREAVLEKFVELLRQALKRRRPRKKTKVSRAAKERRLAAKKQQGLKKKQRGAKFGRED